MPDRLMLIDGHSLVFRGFYALQEVRPLTNAKGELTTGVYAFTSMLLKALEDLKPGGLAAAFDMSRPTHRLAEFSEYKGTRTAAPQGMREQITWSRKVLEAMGVPLFEVEGYEADDVLGALAVKAVEKGLDVIILSGDNDLLQLVNKHVQVLTSRRGITDTILYDEAKVIEKYGGLKPSQVTDFKALRGDVTDNIPGVAGIGDKGAQKLLLEFDSVEDTQPLEEGKLYGHTLTSFDEVDAFLEQLRSAGAFSFNVQATSLLPMRADLVGIGLAAGEDAAYIPLGHITGEQLDREAVLERLRPLLADERIAKRAHNAKFHMLVLARYGVDVRGLVFDSMIAAYLLESGQRALALRDLAWAKVQIELPSVQSLLGIGRKAITMADLPIPECGSYACQEALLVERITPILERELEEAGQTKLFADVEMPLVPVRADMEHVGIAVDLPYLAELGRELQQRIIDLETEIYGHVGHEFNINSTQKLSDVLFGELHLEMDKRRRRIKTKTGHISTGSDILEELVGVHPIIELILEHRQLQKLKGTYVDALQQLVDPNTGRVHTSFNQTGASTGRLSSSDPNLQNIPIRTDTGKRVRRSFIARPGAMLLSADYSQIELRVLAHMAEDPTLLEAFAAGEDPHAVTAAEVLGVPFEKVTSDDRRVAKMVNYGVLYGMSDYGLAERTGLPAEHASGFIRRYFERFGTVKAFQDRVIHKAEDDGYAETLLGRRRYFPEIRSHIWAVRNGAIRATVNAPIQGSASDIVKIAMIRVADFLEDEAPEVKMLLQVHDELLLEGPEPELMRIAPRLIEIMVGALALKAMLHVDLKLGHNWEDMHPLAVASLAHA